MNPQVAEKYSTEFPENIIHMPPYGDVKGFRKKVSDLSLEEADALYNRGDGNNILQLKPPVAKPSAKATTEKSS